MIIINWILNLLLVPKFQLAPNDNKIYMLILRKLKIIHKIFKYGFIIHEKKYPLRTKCIQLKDISNNTPDIIQTETIQNRYTFWAFWTSPVETKRQTDIRDMKQTCLVDGGDYGSDNRYICTCLTMKLLHKKAKEKVCMW